MYVTDFIFTTDYLNGSMSKEEFMKQFTIHTDKDQWLLERLLDLYQKSMILNSKEAIEIYWLGRKFKRNQKKGKEIYKIYDRYIDKLIELRKQKKRYSHKIVKYCKEIERLWSQTTAWRFKKRLKELGFKI